MTIKYAGIALMFLALLLFSCGKGKSRSAGQDFGDAPPSQTQKEEITRQALTLKNGISYRFTDFNPPEKDLLIRPNVNISARLDFPDLHRGKGKLPVGLEIERFTVNATDYTAKLVPGPDSFVVRLDGFNCDEVGRYWVGISLKDSEDNRYVTGWMFEYDPKPPHFESMVRLWEFVEDGTW